MAKLPPWRRDRPIGNTQRGEQVMLSPDFFRFLEEVTQTVDEQDGAAPGGQDFVMFPTYVTEQKPCAFGRYSDATGAEPVRASYQAKQPAAVSAQYGTGCGTVTFARY